MSIPAIPKRVNPQLNRPPEANPKLKQGSER
jgi:hypothetical protein